MIDDTRPTGRIGRSVPIAFATVLAITLLTACGTGSGPRHDGPRHHHGGRGDSPVTDPGRHHGPRTAPPEIADVPSVLGVVETPDGDRCEVCLLLALEPDHRTHGLMGVTDPTLGGHDGMVFVDTEARTGRFWMRGTKMPLTIVFFDGDGTYVDRRDMEPCPDEVADDDCPRYGPDRPFRYAVELAERTPDELLMTTGSVLTLTERPCPDDLAGRPVA